MTEITTIVGNGLAETESQADLPTTSAKFWHRTPFALGDFGELLLAGDGESLTHLLFIDDLTDARARHASLLEGEEERDAFDGVLEWLDRYFAGEPLRTSDCRQPLAPRGTEFDQRVWNALREIPFGETCSYGQLAAAIGSPKAARAVGHANGRNPISIVVPCHRVIGANGRLTGFGGGLPRKARLLDHECFAAR